MKKTSALVAVAIAFGGIAAVMPAQAQFAKTEDAVKYRKAAFTVMGNHMGRLTAMVKGQVPYDAAKAQESARLIETMSKLPWEGFVPNSVSDGMKADPLKEADKFKQHREKAFGEIGKLVSASATLDGLKDQLGKTGGACKSCHEDFRK